MLSSVLTLIFCVVLSVRAVEYIDSPACRCTAGFIPVPVDVTIPVDPTNPLGLNSTDTFRLQTTFNVYGELCEPALVNPKLDGAVQLLLHGLSYTSQYWNIGWNGFQNYSYVTHSCSKGISSFTYDNIGAGRTTRPNEARDCQMPTASNVTSSLARDLKSGRVSRILTGHDKKYSKVIGIGHSLGSGIINYAIIQDGNNSPFDAVVLTGLLHTSVLITKPQVVAAPASQVYPGRYPDLDPGYITTTDTAARTVFYGPSPTSYSSDVLNLDEMTKDMTPIGLLAQVSFIYTPAIGFQGPVVVLLGSFDSILCIPGGGPCNQGELEKLEASFYPDSREFQMIVLGDSGHNLNLDFGASKAFSIMNELFEKFVDDSAISTHESEYTNNPDQAILHFTENR